MKLRQIITQLPHLRRLARIRTVTGRRHLIKHFPPKAIRAIDSCCKNALRGNIPLKRTQKNKLRKYKKHIKALIKPKTSMSRKKKILVQNGGFLSVLLPALAGIIPSIVSAFKK